MSDDFGFVPPVISSPVLSPAKVRTTARTASMGWIVVAVVGATGLVITGFFLDAAFLRWLAQRPERLWEEFVQIVTEAGDWPWLALTVVGGVLIARVFRARRGMTLLCLMFAATLLAGVIVQPLRALTGRARPHPEKVGGWYGLRKEGQWIAGRHRYSSFPSAHTTVAAAFVTPLVVLGGARWLPVCLFALAVGWSRIYLGAHHPSDVMAGLVLGAFCGWILGRAPGLRWWLWRFASAFCGYRRRWPGCEGSAARLLGRSSG